MSNVLDELVVAAPGLAHTDEGARGVDPLPLEEHALRLALLRLGELSGDDDQAEVDHEEGSDLRYSVVQWQYM